MEKKESQMSEIKGFELVLDYLLAARGPRVFKRWFSGLKICEKTSGMVVLTAPTTELVDEISILFGNTDLLAAIRNVWPETGCIRIKSENKPKLKKSISLAQTTLELAA